MISWNVLLSRGLGCIPAREYGLCELYSNVCLQLFIVLRSCVQMISIMLLKCKTERWLTVPVKRGVWRVGMKAKKKN